LSTLHLPNIGSNVIVDAVATKHTNANMVFLVQDGCALRDDFCLAVARKLPNIWSENKRGREM
jgi:hypothetical protein